MPLTRVALIGLLALSACSDNDVVGVHLTLGDGGSGSITTHSLQVLEDAGPAEAGISAVNWEQRVELFSSKGTFSEINQLQIGEIRFNLEGNTLQVTIPRGPEVKWYQSLAPPLDEQEQAAITFDPTGKAKSVGTTVKLDLELPGTVLAVGILPTNVRGVEVEKDKNKVSVWLPLRALRQEGEALFLGVTWR